VDGGGGYCVFGVIDLATRAKAESAVPFGLLNGAKLLRDVKRDQVITYDAVELRQDTLLKHLKKNARSDYSRLTQNRRRSFS